MVDSRGGAVASSRPCPVSRHPAPHRAVLRIGAGPWSQTVPITTAGSAYLDTFANFLAKWQAGKVSNLQKGLQEVDKQIDAKLKQSGGGIP